MKNDITSLNTTAKQNSFPKFTEASLLSKWHNEISSKSKIRSSVNNFNYGRILQESHNEFMKTSHIRIIHDLNHRSNQFVLQISSDKQIRSILGKAESPTTRLTENRLA